MKSYAKRWGLILGATSLLVSLVSISVFHGSSGETILFFSAPIYLVVLMGNMGASSGPGIGAALVSIVLGAFMYFCIGSFLGWIYGKIMRRNEVSLIEVSDTKSRLKKILIVIAVVVFVLLVATLLPIIFDF